MKKNRIFNIVIASISFLLWFMPIEMSDTWVFSIRVFFEAINVDWWEMFIRELLVICFGVHSMIILLVQIIKPNKITKYLSPFFSFAYATVWFVVIFTEFPHRSPLYASFKTGSRVLWLVLYFIMLIAILVLTVIQYIPPHRPTKAERLQAQVDELQRQVDELKQSNDKQ
ncbi:MAG: hypothetical protein NC132_05550 [Corallococcus sp.]|nr:hypothetical protein [Corallococcus sp.]MCM1360001.1 hypothetical protein [Corallococcus sp.]MCM1395558.1 hypothetical protein [Corallococcus sp.]